MPNRHQTTSTNVEDYWQLFVNRRAYVLQSKRPHPEKRARYYYADEGRKERRASQLNRGDDPPPSLG